MMWRLLGKTRPLLAISLRVCGGITLTGRVSSTLIVGASFTTTAGITGTGDLTPTSNSAEAGVR